MSETSSDNVKVYLKVIEYKRSIGITQWTVLSIFVTASEAVFVLSLAQDDRLTSTLVRVFGAMVYWLGFLLYNRYRGLNIAVSKYLVELEKEIGFEFQQHLNNQFHNKGLSTRNILLVAGILYLILVIVISIV